MTRLVEPNANLRTRLVAQIALLNARRFGLRLYQWLWVLLCVFGALIVAAPRVLSQPVLFHADAQTRFDIARYGGLYNLVAPQVTGLAVALGDTTEVLRQDTLAHGDVRYGRPDYVAQFIPQEPGVVLVRGIAGTATEAQTLANAGAEELARQVRAAGGREILRNMLGWELWLALEPTRQPTPEPFDLLLHEIIRTQAFPMSRELEPFSTPRSLATLPREEVSDVARALEARYDLWRFSINTRNATLDAFCGISGGTATNTREQALLACSTTNSRAAAELAERDREVNQLRAIEATLRFVVGSQHATFDPDTPSAAHRVVAVLPAESQPRYVPHLIALAMLFGLAFGVIGVAVDHNAGVAAKILELWGYRELLRNLVLRDLRARYKGSALGYLWTQLAPLGMMLVYVVVFSVLMPSGIAQFPVFIIVGLLPWNFAAEAVMGGTRSVIDGAALIKKVYFPREVLPLVAMLSSLLNFLLSLPMMFLVMAAVQWTALGRLNFAWSFAYLPVLLIIQSVMLAGMALLLSAIAVFFRDMVHLVGILVNIWFFLSPVIYPLGTFGNGPAVLLIRWLNPMASLLEFYRETLYGSAVALDHIPTPAFPALTSVLRVSVTALLMLGFGYWSFQKVARRFGEEL